MQLDCCIDVSDLSTANPDCVVCALLARAAEPYWNHKNRGCYITREKSALSIGNDRRHFLRLCITPGQCN